MRRWKSVVFGGVVAGMSLCSVVGQWATQEIILKPGWNSVYLEVQPEPRRCDELFAGLPIEKVWSWDGRPSEVQHLRDPETIELLDGQWRVYLPVAHPSRTPHDPSSEVIDLFTLDAGRSYLIKSSAQERTRWEITGRVVVHPLRWDANAYSLVGFGLDVEQRVNVDSIIGASARHDPSRVFELLPSGAWQAMGEESVMERSKAYWMWADGVSDFSGPIGVQLEQGSGLTFGRVLNEERLIIRNQSSETRRFTVESRHSLPSPPGFPVVAGSVPLRYWNPQFERVDYAGGESPWLPFDRLERSLEPGEEWLLRLEVRRQELAPWRETLPEEGLAYASLIDVRDNAGSRVRVPVTVETSQTSDFSLNPLGRSSRSGLARAMEGGDELGGLWVGHASIYSVSQPGDVGDPFAVTRTASTFDFRLIVHVDGSGDVRLLQQVYQGWEPPETNDSVGRFVLLTDKDLIEQNESTIRTRVGGGIVDGVPIARRISAPAFSFGAPLQLSGNDFGTDFSVFNGTIGIEPLDPLNPYRHKFHKEHNTGLGIQRVVNLRFRDDFSRSETLPGSGSKSLSGDYWEFIYDIHRDPIVVYGNFRLSRISDLVRLDDLSLDPGSNVNE